MAGIIECEQIGELSHQEHIDDDAGEDDEVDEEDYGAENYYGGGDDVDDSDAMPM